MPKSEAHERLYRFLQTREEGDTVTERDILVSMGWAPKTLQTYTSKNKLALFISRINADSFKVLRNGNSITVEDVYHSFTQTNPKEVVFVEGMTLRGAKGIYRLVKCIGEGAVGHVWSSSTSNGKYAVKVLQPRRDLLDPSHIHNVRDRFRREVQNGGRLNHPRIVVYHDYGDYQGCPFLVMELASSSSARQLKERGRFALDETIPLVSNCLEGLEHLHSLKCVHRDVKPDNILVTDKGYVLGDLGIVRWNEFHPDFTSAGTVTRASVQLGSWYYMAPEQIADPHGVSFSSDIYSLGITWYELLTGRPPFPQAVIAKKHAPACGDHTVNELINRMVEYEPENRPSIADIKSNVRELGGYLDLDGV